MGCCAGGLAATGGCFSTAGADGGGAGVVTGALAAGETGEGGGRVAAGGCCAGGVTITAGGGAGAFGIMIAGFSCTGGGATGGAGFCTGGATTAGFSGSTITGGAGAFGIMIAGFSCTGGGATGGAVTGLTGALGGMTGGAAATGGRGGTTGRCSCSSRSLSLRATSPGLCTLEKSILGLTSGAGVRSRALAELDLAVKCLRMRSASWSSMDDEWVFFSLMPISGKASRISLLFTSSSLARSLIRIFTLCVSSKLSFRRS